MLIGICVTIVGIVFVCSVVDRLYYIAMHPIQKKISKFGVFTLE